MTNWYLVHLFIGFLIVVYLRKEIRKEKFWSGAGMVFILLGAWSFTCASFGLKCLWDKIKGPLKNWVVLYKNDLALAGVLGSIGLFLVWVFLTISLAQTKSEHISELKHLKGDCAKVAKVIHEISMDEIDQRFYEIAMTSYASGDAAPLNKWIEGCQQSLQSGILPRLPNDFERTDVVKIGDNAILVPSPVFPN